MNFWEQKKLGDVVKITMGQSPKSDNYTDNPEDYILVQGNADIKNNKVYPRVWTKQITKTANKGDIILTVRAPVGEVGKTDYDVVLGRGVSGIKGNNFIYYSLKKLNSNGYWTKYSTGSTFESINSNDINNAIILISSEKEQKRIGEFFEKVDSLITLHQRKLELLKQNKKFFLQKMFPKNGEKIPEIRFSEFNNDWVQRKLGETASLRGRIGFRGYKQTDLVAKGNGAITLSPSDIDENGNISFENNKYISWDKFEESPEIQVNIGDILFTKTASIGKIGFVSQLPEKATINPQIALVTPFPKELGYFIFLSLRLDEFTKKVRIITGGSSVPTISQEKLKELTFKVPNTDEQQKISIFFKKVDSLITLQQRKIELLKQNKKYLLNKLFI